MSQRCARIHVKVNNPEVWRRYHFSDEYWDSIWISPDGYNFTEMADQKKTYFVIDSEWGIPVNMLINLVHRFAEKLGEDGIIIADSTDLNVDPYDDCIYYLGGRVREKTFDVYNDKAEMFFDTSIEDIPAWLNYGGFTVNSREKQILLKNGILYESGRFSAFSQNFGSMGKIYLRETSFEGRPEIIEKTIVGEEVYFVNSKNSYGLEVMSELGSLGTLPSDISDQLSGLLETQHIKYTAVVSEVIPASKRNKHAKSSIVVINIDAQFSENKVPKKTSVPKVNR